MLKAAMLPALLALLGIVQALVGLAAVVRFRRPGAPKVREASLPPVSVLKPLHGDEPGLEAALRSFCRQRYPAFQLVFGVQDAADPALPVLRRILAGFPSLDSALVIDPTPHGINPKVANLVNMLPQARHDILIVADSDMRVREDYLARVVAALQVEGVGLVTTLYSGLPTVRGLVARLGATRITHGFLPAVLLARGLGRQDCLGGTMALRRSVLDEIGGFAAFVGYLADDAALGREIIRLGLKVELARTVPRTSIAETRLAALIAHELRWDRTMRSLAPLGFALSAIQHPIAWALLAILLSGAAVWAWLLLALAWAARALVAVAIDRALGRPEPNPFWLLPLRDALSLGLQVASFLGDRVDWQGQTLRVDRWADVSLRGSQGR